MTGYPTHQDLGRKLRFMQGPETDAGTIDAVRRAVR
jgi:PAS domain-containing protein